MIPCGLKWRVKDDSGFEHRHLGKRELPHNKTRSILGGQVLGRVKSEMWFRHPWINVLGDLCLAFWREVWAENRNLNIDDVKLVFKTMRRVGHLGNEGRERRTKAGWVWAHQFYKYGVWGIWKHQQAVWMGEGQLGREMEIEGLSGSQTKEMS